MKISARNCLKGTHRHQGRSCDHRSEIETEAKEKIVSSITTASAQSLGLKVGGEAYAVIKASSVMVAVAE